MDLRFVAPARLTGRDETHETPLVVVAIEAHAREELATRRWNLGSGDFGDCAECRDTQHEDGDRS
jgi:hypothetical protein